MVPSAINWRDLTLGTIVLASKLSWQKHRIWIYTIIVFILTMHTSKKIYKIRHHLKTTKKQAALRQKRSEDRKRQCDQLEKTEIYTPAKDAITKLTFSDLQKKLMTKEISARDVIDAYLMKAAEAHKVTNCIVEVLSNAKSASRQLDINGETTLPLFGIPISIKESIDIKGTYSTMGCSLVLDQEQPDDDAAIIKVLKEQGAIPFVKTNIPQTMMSYECSNPIYGQTVNPFDKSRSCGGSSGGEAALIASGGSILGYGTDIGGSIRVPSHMCGICGIKPTVGRNSKKGGIAINAGQVCVTGTFGPMARDMDTLVAGMKAILHPHITRFDHRQAYLPFDDEIYLSDRKLKIGYYKHDGCFHAVRACQRAVEHSINILKKNGHQVTEWKFNYGKQGYQLAKTTFGADGMASFTKYLKNDTIDKDCLFEQYLPYLPEKIATFIHKYKHPESVVSTVANAKNGVGSVQAYFELTEAVRTFQDKVVEDWKSHEFDVVICPAYATTAPKHGWFKRSEGVGSYTLVYNVLNFPAGVVPVTKVSEDDMTYNDSYPVIDPSHQVIKESIPGSKGLPVGVQVVALPYKEEVCLRVMKLIETLNNN